ncbi:MAG: HAD-IIB family hydrolase [Acidobacteria bacterium]|nr:HAD-IIB family hydrolase [Acidobacteriota bacterium]
MLIFITDMDGTLLDADYGFEEAQPALQELKERQIPLVFCTSKTRAEVEAYRRQLDNTHPFIVENGGALYIPESHFPVPICSAEHRDGYAVIEFGSPYPEIVDTLLKAAEESGCTVLGFSQMSVEEISRRCNLPPAAAQLAKQREYDEPFEILAGDSDRLLKEIEKRKKRWTRGGRFYHILGANDKGHCVILLRHFYERIYQSVVVAGLGDGMNDAGFLNVVDIPLLMESDEIEDLKKAVPRGRICPGGPRGWNATVLDVIRNYSN